MNPLLFFLLGCGHVPYSFLSTEYLYFLINNFFTICMVETTLQIAKCRKWTMNAQFSLGRRKKKAILHSGITQQFFRYFLEEINFYSPFYAGRTSQLTATIWPKSPSTVVAELGEDLGVLNVCWVLYPSSDCTKTSFTACTESLHISLNPLCLSCVQVCATCAKICSLSASFHACCWQRAEESWPRRRYFTVHLEAGFADLGQNSGPTEINGKTSVRQDFTPGN